VKTLASPASIEVEIKRSRFIAHAARIDSLADSLAFYESVADHTATHNCWAWKLDHQYRFNDDGEPASTAGKPIYSAIDGKQLDHVMVVVTRHYGGIKLGVGGLIRAYGGSAARCIDQAGIIDIQPRVTCTIEAGFKWTGQLYTALEQCGAQKLGEDYPPGGILVRAELLESALPVLREKLRDATRGEAVVRIASPG
jgi:uncharacterized YigZ family protein